MIGGGGVGPGFDTGLAGSGSGMPAPLHVPGLWIARFEPAGTAARIAGDAGEYVIADHDGSDGGEVRRIGRNHLFVPALAASGGFERDDVVVGCFKVEPLAPQSHAAISDSAAPAPEIMPNLTARVGIDGVGVIRNREVEHSVDHQRNRFNGGARGVGAGRVGRRIFIFSSQNGAVE